MVTVAVDVTTLVSESELAINTTNCSSFSNIWSSRMLMITGLSPVSRGWNVTLVVGIGWKSEPLVAVTGVTDTLKIYKFSLFQ